MTENNLEMAIDSMVASRESRREDWDTLAFQTKAGPEYRRAQIRYVGSGGTGHHENDGLILEAEHDHHDVEEAFFVLEGELEVTIHDGDQTASRVMGYRDLIKVPPNTPRSLRNIGDTDALFIVMLGAKKPQLPTYPATSPMAGINRD